MAFHVKYQLSVDGLMVEEVLVEAMESVVVLVEVVALEVVREFELAEVVALEMV